GSISNSFVPQQHVLKQFRNRVRLWRGPFRSKLRQSSCEQFRDGGSVPSAFDRHSAIGIGNLLSLVHGSSAFNRIGSKFTSRDRRLGIRFMPEKKVPCPVYFVAPHSTYR